MSYTPTNWQTGDTVTAERLNKMEGGIQAANDVFVITLTPTAEDFSGTHNRTIAEISAAVLSHKKIVFEMDASSIGIPSLRFNANVAQDDSIHENEFSAKGLFVFTADSILVLVETDTFDDGYYSTVSYPLTPMS